MTIDGGSRCGPIGGPSGIARDRHHCNVRYAAPMAPAVGRAQVDARDASVESSRGARRDPAVGRADGWREFHMGLHADSRSAEQRRASRRPLDDRPDLEGALSAAGAGAADVVADVSARTLGRDRGRRFLHDGGLDVAWLGHLLHGVRHRPGLTSRADRRIDTASRPNRRSDRRSCRRSRARGFEREYPRLRAA